MFVVVVVSVARCLGLKIPFMGYVSGDCNVFPPAFGYYLVCSQFHQSNSAEKKSSLVIPSLRIHTF